jgi:hypothetical protein
MPSETYTVSPDVIWAEGEDEINIYDSAHGEFQTLNSSGAEVWRLVAGGREIQDIVTELTGRYDNGDPRETALIAEDTRAFVAALLGQGLLIPANGDAPDGVSG